jgi:hypothetical protein
MLLIAMYVLLDVSVVLALCLAPLAAAFLLRTFVVFHDCTHGSLFSFGARFRARGRVAAVPASQIVCGPRRARRMVELAGTCAPRVMRRCGLG